MEETIYSAAEKACRIARQRNAPFDFTFMGTEVRARPDSSMMDLAEIWFWKRQWKHILGMVPEEV